MSLFKRHPQLMSGLGKYLLLPILLQQLCLCLLLCHVSHSHCETPAGAELYGVAHPATVDHAPYGGNCHLNQCKQRALARPVLPTGPEWPTPVAPLLSPLPKIRLAELVRSPLFRPPVSPAVDKIYLTQRVLRC